MKRQVSLRAVYRRLHRRYGPQHWWPGDTAFEVLVGAVLTQNAAWANVERAIGNLAVAGCLDARRIAEMPPAGLAELVRPSGYFNVKAGRLQNLCRWYLEKGGMDSLCRLPTDALRREILAVNGVGQETADDILLYAFARPVFVIDAYTRRIFSRLGLCRGDESYEALRHVFEHGLRGDAPLYNEYHALIVRHAKVACKRKPLCDSCCLVDVCAQVRNVP
ncbi:MAG: Endonuclease III [Gammaproteobacteria bacterium]|nr:Endonuclease III [Gammaproteobacteria bacterium]